MTTICCADATIRDVACPQCLARPGEPCMLNSTAQTECFHHARHRAAATAARTTDALEQRLDDIAALDDGWDGPGSIAPPTAALAAVRSALGRHELTDRHLIECSAHADGYLALTVRGEHADDAWMADVHADRTEYEANGMEWVGPTEAGALEHELRVGLALARLTTG